MQKFGKFIRLFLIITMLGSLLAAVSYTHLTLPTTELV